MTELLIREAEIAAGVRTDLLIRDGVVAATGTGLPADGIPVLEAGGAAVLPGLHDHHLHLHALAAADKSVRCGPPAVHTVTGLARALAAAPGDGWIRGTGYVETVAGLLDAAGLDAVHRARPVRLQHRSGALWILNSAAARLVELDSATASGVERDSAGRATGRIWRADTWLRSRLPDAGPPDLTTIGAVLARYGITGVTDATPDLTPDSLGALVAATRSGAFPQRLNLLGVPLGSTSDPPVGTGAYKIVLDDSGLPDIDDLAATVSRAHVLGRPVAVHCVSREALLILLAVFDEAGTVPGDRIEHAALVGADCLADLRRLGVTVVTQPGFLTDRGDDYLRRVDPDDRPDLYRCRSLTACRVAVAFSSDAPYGPVDPWQVIDAAVTRRAPGGAVVGPGERLGAMDALIRYLTPLHDPGGRARTITPGVPADLVLLDPAPGPRGTGGAPAHDRYPSSAQQYLNWPLTPGCAPPTAASVRATVIGGRVVFER